MEFEGKVYAGDVYVGTLRTSNFITLKRRASTLCNRYYKPVDTIVLTRASGRDVDDLKLIRVNKIAPNNTIERGSWV